MEAIATVLRLLFVSELLLSTQSISFLENKLWQFHRRLKNKQVNEIITRIYNRTPEMFSGSEELVEAQGMELESHRVVTEDGYVLSLHRLMSPGDTSTSVGRTPVLLVHGFLCASHLWLLTPKHHALAYLLWDRGYDVWFANLRGNAYSKHHIQLSTSDMDFWNFSWHEMGFYDVPAFVDYILHATNHQQLFYIGHSMGNTVYYVMTTTRPEYNDKVRLHVGLAPAVFLGPRREPIAKLVVSHGPALVRSLEHDGLPELLPLSPARAAFFSLLCQGVMQRIFCRQSYDRIYGPSNPQLNASLIGYFVVHAAQGTSVRTLGHFTQSILSGQFRWYDEGSTEENIRRYGQPDPPSYDLSLATAPSALWFSDDDWVVFPEDVMRLVTAQKRVVLLTRVPVRPYNHLDFLFAPGAVETLYEPILRVLQLY